MLSKYISFGAIRRRLLPPQISKLCQYLSDKSNVKINDYYHHYHYWNSYVQECWVNIKSWSHLEAIIVTANLETLPAPFVSSWQKAKVESTLWLIVGPTASLKSLNTLLFLVFLFLLNFTSWKTAAERSTEKLKNNKFHIRGTIYREWTSLLIKANITSNKLQKFEAVSNYGSATDHITSRMWFPM